MIQFLEIAVGSFQCIFNLLNKMFTFLVTMNPFTRSPLNINTNKIVHSLSCSLTGIKFEDEVKKKTVGILEEAVKINQPVLFGNYSQSEV